MRYAFLDLCIDARQKVLPALMEADRIALCSRKCVPNAGGRAARGGSTGSRSCCVGITFALCHTRRATSPIENLNGSLTCHCRNVKRWGDGQMVRRWVVCALRGCSLSILVAAPRR